MPTSLARPRITRLALTLGLGLSLVVGPPAASGATISTFVPIGAGYAADTLEQFAAQAAAVDASGTVEILVLPITYGVDPLSMSNGLRNKNLTLADTRRGQIEAACLAVIPAGESCSVVLAPVLVRADAFEPANVALVTPGLDGIYTLGGDQVVGMQVVANTPLDAALASASAAGAVTSGNSAGAAVESADMIAGYTGANGPEQGFEQGAVDLWLDDGPTDETRGLVYGLQGVLLDQHVLQRGRIARLITASFEAGEVGIGCDADTAATIMDGTHLTAVGGASAAFVADSLTYAATRQYDGTGTVSIHDIATHVLPAGDGYELASRQPVVGGSPVAAPDLAGRTFPSLATPAGSGTLLLSGSPSAAVLDRLVAASGGSGSSIVVLIAGQSKAELATKDGKALAAELAARGATASWFNVGTKTDGAAIAALAGADGVLLTAGDPFTVLGSLRASSGVVDAVHAAWLGGATLLANDAAASALGSSLTTQPRPGDTTAQIESAAVREFRPDGTAISAGLGWVDVAVEPGIVSNRHWGRLYSLLANAEAADRVSFGVDAGTALELGPALAAPRVVGSSVVVALDGRSGSFGVGTNGTLAARWVILDTFVGGQEVAP
jgi:cyanophycinase